MLSDSRQGKGISEGLRHTAQIAVLTVAGLGSFSPALGQMRNEHERTASSTEDLPVRIKEPVLEPPRNIPAIVSPKAEDVAISPQPNWTLAGLGALCSVSAMAIFYRQLKRRETPVSATSIGLYTTNDTLLCATALFTGQGIVGVAVMGTMAVCGAVCTREAMKQSQHALKFQNTDKICAALCVPGLAAVCVSQTSLLTPYISPVNLAMIGSVLGVAVNLISSVPLMREQLSPVKPDEKLLDVQNGRAWAMVKPVMPYVIGSMGMGLAVLNAGSMSFTQLFQPAALFATNVVLAGMTLLWAARRASRPLHE